MDYKIIALGEVTSTNDVAMAEDYAEGTIVTARRQTAGRGQRGNRWENGRVAGENLLFSLVLEPRRVRGEQQFLISMMAALAASDAVRICTEREGGGDCTVKWPNDLYIGDRKVGGILIEHSLQGEFLTRSVVGIGINIGQREFDPELPNPTSLALELGGAMGRKLDPVPSPEAVLAAFCEAFERRYGQSEEQLHRDYTMRLWRGDGFYPYRELRGDTHGGLSDGLLNSPSERFFEATIREVNPHTGELTLLDTCGQPRRYWFKEVEAVL